MDIFNTYLPVAGIEFNAGIVLMGSALIITIIIIGKLITEFGKEKRLEIQTVQKT